MKKLICKQKEKVFRVSYSSRIKCQSVGQAFASQRTCVYFYFIFHYYYYYFLLNRHFLISIHLWLLQDVAAVYCKHHLLIAYTHSNGSCCVHSAQRDEFLAITLNCFKWYCIPKIGQWHHYYFLQFCFFCFLRLLLIFLFLISLFVLVIKFNSTKVHLCRRTLTHACLTSTLLQIFNSIVHFIITSYSVSPCMHARIPTALFRLLSRIYFVVI